MTDSEHTAETERARRSYDRIAPLYDLMEWLPERRYRGWRARLWSEVRGPRVLEVGVGTGRNLPFHPSGLRVTAIDLSPKMLSHARDRARELGTDIDLREGDVEALEFEDGSFDEVVATFVFCSVPDPLVGLREVRRVLKPHGRLLLLEHVRARNAILGRAMDLANPISVRTTGVNINRRTVETVAQAGFELERVEDVGLRGVFELIVARRPVS